ncbi:MAG: DUF1801 domain-containing protein [Candidatus Micrarchaeota archaeon]|nr:DUF1801 domain-containing protein [Candidatus Micrarchaeota archaeon]
MRINSGEVDSYIASAPKGAQQKLKQMRKAIRDAAPKAVEGISYKMPSYDKGKVAWFASMRGYIGLYLRPPIIAENKKELKNYKTTKSAIHFPLDEKLPVSLIKKLVRARIRKNRGMELYGKKKR